MNETGEAGRGDNRMASDQFDPLINITHLVYALQALSCLIGITYVVAVVVNYVKLDDVRGTWLESHFRWQIRTFWYSLLWFALSGILALVVIGWIGVFATVIWVIYRIVKGWLDLAARKPMYRTVVSSTA